MTPPADRSLLLGPASADRYVDESVVLPGGGALNMAWHFARAGEPVHLLTRIGDDGSQVFLPFLDRHRIGYSPESIVAPGATSSIEIVIGPDRQPFMDHFVEGVWRDFRLTDDEERLLGHSSRLHVVLVDPVVRELDRLATSGRLDATTVSGDFLSFRRWAIDRFAATMHHLDVGVIGWPGDPQDPTVAEIRDIAFDLGKLVVVTLGALGVRVFDGSSGPHERFVPVEPVAVAGTTIGCGDAFVAAFLSAWWSGAGVDASVTAGTLAGAAATAWRRPLPDEAYRAVC